MTCDIHEQCPSPCPIEAKVIADLWAENVTPVMSQEDRAHYRKLGTIGARKARAASNGPLPQRGSK